MFKRVREELGEAVALRLRAKFSGLTIRLPTRRGCHPFHPMARALGRRLLLDLVDLCGEETELAIPRAPAELRGLAEAPAAEVSAAIARELRKSTRRRRREG